MFHQLAYALNQVVHNFGAAAVLGLSAYGILQGLNREITQRTVFLILTIVWAVQGASGVMFGIATLSFYGQLPDIHGVAVIALWVKIVCAVLGLVVAFIGFRKSGGPQGPSLFFPIATFGFGATALTAAAFLRWFS